MEIENISSDFSTFGDYQQISASEVNNSYYGDYYSYEEKQFDNVAGAVALWRAVLLQAFIDLKSQSKKKRNQPIKNEAYRWFNSANQNQVKMVCQLAKYNYNDVKKCFNKIISRDFKR